MSIQEGFKSSRLAEISFKNKLSPIIYKLISEINENLESNKKIDYSSKVVVTGGEALNFYFNNPAFNTPDFDLKLFLGDNNLILNYLNKYYDETFRKDLEFKLFKDKVKAVNYFIKKLNVILNFKNNSIIQSFKKSNFILDPVISITINKSDNSVKTLKNGKEYKRLYETDKFIREISHKFFDDVFKPEEDRIFGDVFHFYFFLNYDTKTDKYIFSFDSEALNISNYGANDSPLTTPLSSVSYFYMFGQQQTNILASIIDLIPYTRSSFNFIGMMNKFYSDRDNKLYEFSTPENYKKIENNVHRIQYYISNNNLRAGYFDTLFLYSEFGSEGISKNIYVMKLGFVLWDTIRMLNYITDILLALPDKRFEVINYYDVLYKYDKYLKKYQAIVTSLSFPEKTLSCDSMRDFIKKCNSELFCKIGSEKATREGIVNKLIAEGLIPPTFKESVLQLPFSLVCETLEGEMVN
jgi:hypothetical protein